MHLYLLAQKDALQSLWSKKKGKLQTADECEQCNSMCACLPACVHVEGVGTHTTEPQWIPLENAEYLGDTAGFHFTPSTESG